MLDIIKVVLDISFVIISFILGRYAINAYTKKKIEEIVKLKVQKTYEQYTWRIKQHNKEHRGTHKLLDNQREWLKNYTRMLIDKQVRNDCFIPTFSTNPVFEKNEYIDYTIEKSICDMKKGLCNG